MLKKAITIILALAMMSVTSVFASNETEESNNATQIEQNDEVTAFDIKSGITWHYRQQKLQL